jgi:hypothetical protein
MSYSVAGFRLPRFSREYKYTANEQNKLICSGKNQNYFLCLRLEHFIYLTRENKCKIHENRTFCETCSDTVNFFSDG